VTWRHRVCDHSIPHVPFPIVFHCNWLSISSRFEIMGFKHIRITTLTFQGHVTSSVTWRFRFPIWCYWFSIGTKPLSPSVFVIFGSKAPVRCKSSLRMRDIMYPVPPIQNFGTYFSFSPPHCQFTMALLLGSDEE